MTPIAHSRPGKTESERHPMEFVTTVDALRDTYAAASDGALRKQMAQLDPHARLFSSKSPFVMIGTQDDAGNGDVTPKGDRPGFAAVLDAQTIALPDRPGNNRLDTLENVIRNPAIGLCFMIPGMNETLRINGDAQVTVDPALCEQLGVNGRPAISVLVVSIREVYLHCAKAYIRSGLWQPDTWPDRAEMPSFGEMLRDQLSIPATAQAIDDNLEQGYRKSMW